MLGSWVALPCVGWYLCSLQLVALPFSTCPGRITGGSCAGCKCFGLKVRYGFNHVTSRWLENVGEHMDI